jgi:two-component system sensor histidine kinase EvgS
MPKLDGIGLLKKIQRNAKLSHIPVIAYSASAMKEQKEHIFNCKFAGLLLKPVHVTDLYIELMNYLPYTSTQIKEKDKSALEQTFAR